MKCNFKMKVSCTLVPDLDVSSWILVSGRLFVSNFACNGTQRFDVWKVNVQINKQKCSYLSIWNQTPWCSRAGLSAFVGGFKDIPFLQLISKRKNLLLDRIEACHFFCALPRELVKTRGMNNYHRRTSWVGWGGPPSFGNYGMTHERKHYKIMLFAWFPELVK